MIRTERKNYFVETLLLLLLFLISGLVMAQQDRFRWRLGAGVGNQYVGGTLYDQDTLAGDGAVSLEESFLSYSAFMELSLSKDFGLKVFTTTIPGDLQISNSGLVLSYYTDNDYLFSSEAFVAPYLNLSLAFGNTSNGFNIPFGGGIKFRLGNRINLNVDYTFRTYTRRWDDANYDFTDEVQAYSSVSLHYNFGRKRKAYKAPVPYVSSYPSSSDPLVSEPAESQVTILPEGMLEMFRDSLKSAFEKGNPEAVLVIDSAMADSALQVNSSVFDTTHFKLVLEDSISRAQFLERYGKILRTPSFGDTNRVIPKSFESTVATGTTDQFKRIAIVPSEGGSAKAAMRPSERDSVIDYLEYKVKRQRLQNELSTLQKAKTDSTANALISENKLLKEELSQQKRIEALEQRLANLEDQPTSTTTQTASDYTPTPTTTPTSTTEVRIVDDRTRNNSGVGNALASAGAGALAGGVASSSQNRRIERLEDKIDSLQKQLWEMSSAMKAQQIMTTPAVGIGSTPQDSTASDSTKTPRQDSVVVRYDTVEVVKEINDSIPSPNYVSEEEFKVMQRELAKAQKQVDSLLNAPKPKAEPSSSVTKKPSSPSAMNTGGKVEVFFEISSSGLNTTSQKQLNEVVNFAKENPEAGFLVKGFTDKTGSVAFNGQLSQKRAQAVYDYLKENGVGGDRLKVVSLGPDQSLSGGSQSYGRRVEVILN